MEKSQTCFLFLATCICIRIKILCCYDMNFQKKERVIVSTIKSAAMGNFFFEGSLFGFWFFGRKIKRRNKPITILWCVGDFRSLSLLTRYSEHLRSLFLWCA